MELPLTLAEAAKLIKTRTVSPVELTQAVLRRIEATSAPSPKARAPFFLLSA
jgi:Asp-tRNA(Asn)/Glu-tRNA(Gln) amidotransferase A subunit family amidase